MAGNSEVSPISSAFGVTTSADLKKCVREVEMVETVYGGYPDHNRICFPGDHNPIQHRTSSSFNNTRGVMEHKSKLALVDIALPSAPYDLRLTLSTERKLASNVKDVPKGWKTRRFKRRRSYTRTDGSFAWQLDVTEVTTASSLDGLSSIVGREEGREGGEEETQFEIEAELNQRATLKIINETDETKAHALCDDLAQQLWWMVGQINPMVDVLDVEDFLRDHPNHHAVQLALAQCGALKSFLDCKNRTGGYGEVTWCSAIYEEGKSPSPSPAMCNIKFPGCMPVNFSRNNIEEVQRCDKNRNGGGGYFLSEKTDGVRYFMVFTGDTVVLVDRKMKGKQLNPHNSAIAADGRSSKEPMSPILSLIKPGTVFDGEVVMHRKLRRPLYIVFDVLCISSTEPILHLPFRTRLKHLKQATFRTKSASKDMFAQNEDSLKTALPLVRKNFVMRTELDGMLDKVVEEKGVRSYKNGDLHNHLTDGIIFQPDKPYVCGTDVRLLKWKYLDTVTIDVEILPSDPSSGRSNTDNGENVLDVGVLGEEGTLINMTRFIHLPRSEKLRLEADRNETKAKIAEVGLDPTTGEWYYLTMRPDKISSNHISTVLGSLMELAESLGTDELRYRMSVQPGTRDTYRKDSKNMLKQLLKHQRDKNKTRSISGRKC